MELRLKSAFSPSLFLLLWSLCTVVTSAAKVADRLDLYLLVDRSSSISVVDYRKMLDFVEKLPTKFPLGEDKTLVSMVHLATKAELAFRFVDNEKQFKDELAQIQAKDKKGFTGTHAALNYVREHVIKYEQRKKVADVVIILTDGCTELATPATTAKARQDAEYEAELLRNMSVIVFLVFVGPEECLDHQQKLVGDPNKFRVSIKDFDLLTDKIFDNIRNDLIDQLCTDRAVCYYADDQRKTCVAGWWRPVSSATFDCNDEKKEDPPSCSTGQCENDCKGFLLVNDEDCKLECGVEGRETWCKACRRCNPKATGLGGDRRSGDDETRGMQPWMWALIGTAIAVLLLMLGLVVLAVVVVRRKRRRKRMQNAAFGKKANDESFKSHSNKPQSNKSRSKSAADGKTSKLQPASPKDVVAPSTARRTFPEEGESTGKVVRLDVTMPPKDKSAGQLETARPITDRKTADAFTAKEAAESKTKRSKSKATAEAFTAKRPTDRESKSKPPATAAFAAKEASGSVADTSEEESKAKKSKAKSKFKESKAKESKAKESKAKSKAESKAKESRAMEPKAKEEPKAKGPKAKALTQSYELQRSKSKHFLPHRSQPVSHSRGEKWSKSVLAVRH